MQAQESSCNVFFFFASDGPWPLQIILHNTCSLFSTSNFSFGVKKKKRRRKETENVLSCLSLRFSLTHCGLFALMGAEPGKRWQWKPEVNAHWTATVSVSVHVVHRLTRPHLQPPAVSFPVTFFSPFFTVTVRSFSSHLVNSWNCLLPQKCFKFYIIVLMFYK